MTSCSYQHVSSASASIKRAACLQLHHHHFRKPCSSSKMKNASQTQAAINAEKDCEIHTNTINGTSSKLVTNPRPLSRLNLGNKLTFSLPQPKLLDFSSTRDFRALEKLSLPQSHSKMERNFSLLDTAGNTPDGLCSPLYPLERTKCSRSTHANLKSAPNLLRNLSADQRDIPKHSVGGVGVVEELSFLPFSSTEKAGGWGESSWASLNFTRFPVPTERILRIFHAVYNHQRYRDFLLRRNFVGQTTMSLSLLLDPIIGSPPSNLSSPLVEARDDISALSDGYKRKVTVFRRKLSTSFDEPPKPEQSKGRSVAGLGGRSVNLDHVGPFGFKSSPKKVLAHKIPEEDNQENGGKKEELSAQQWLEFLHEKALVEAKSNVGESSGSEESFSRDGGSGDGDSSDEGSGSKQVVTAKPQEDMFELLEKVIGFKGRNVSHITVEQSVKDLCTVYMDGSDEDKLKFFMILAEKYGVDHEHVSTIASSLAGCKGAGDVALTLEEKLRGALVPKSQWLFTQIGRLENGVKFLVDLRTDLLDAIERSQGKSSLKALNNSLRDLIGMWFNVGFLNLERVTWQSSCDMLQKVSEYEAVHPMRNWTDLKKRVGPNRRCFVFTHNSMPGEPVVVLHTFLTDHIASSVRKIVSNHRMRMMSLDSDLPMTSGAEDPDFISTAIFYSITSTQRGLTGIELGNYLIKRVVRELQKEFPKMTQFSSLSPIPGFTKWLMVSVRNAMKDPSAAVLFTEQEMEVLKPLLEKHNKDEQFSFYKVFLDLLKVNSWYSDETLVKELEKPLMRLCANYLFVVKRRGYALDPVAHFHLKNGAVMWRLNWMGDDSPRGLGQSCGMMVNYRYFLDACETNSQNYMEDQVIQVSDQVRRLAKATDSRL